MIIIYLNYRNLLSTVNFLMTIKENIAKNLQVEAVALKNAENVLKQHINIDRPHFMTTIYCHCVFLSELCIRDSNKQNKMKTNILYRITLTNIIKL